jgi:hypothetical protein
MIPEQSVVCLSHRHSMSSMSLGHADAVGNSLNFFAPIISIESLNVGMLSF